MPTVEPAIDFPSPPIDRFPEATIKRPWLKASYDLGLNAASGRMLARTVKGGIREYRFEVAFSGGVPRPTVSAGDAPNADDFGNRDGNPGFREITGLPKGSREDLLDCVRRIGAHLRDLALEQQQWLLEQFETVAQPAVVSRRDGGALTKTSQLRSTYATHGGWLIIRTEGVADDAVRTMAKRLSADGSAGELVLRHPPDSDGARHSNASAIGGKKQQNAGRPGPASALCLSGSAHMRKQKGRYRRCASSL
jgi:hypothetical protein